MEYKMTQGELCEAVELYLNDKVLQRRVRIVSVKPIGYPTPKNPEDLALDVVVLDDQGQLPESGAEGT